ncbi:S8 family peptidase [Micromonospora sp. DT81.3]|uniref:S8 family peptidase n=1 Tax=Micromonospora sp. DT81.3 TaxID=3416523 RepID=UPI003CEF8EF5
MNGNHTTRRARLITAASIASVSLVGALLGAAPATAAKPTGIYTVSFTSSAAADAAIGRLGIAPDAKFTSAINGFTGELSPVQLATLRASTTVRGVSANTVIIGAAQVLTPAAKSVEADKAPTNATTAGTWDGPGVAILDSGVSLHTDLNVAKQVNCLPNGDGQDGNGHGTAVAGAAVAINNSVGLVGVAPAAPIYSVRVLDDKLAGTVAYLMCGLDWVAQNHDRFNIKVLNLSMQYVQADDGNCGYSNGDTVHQAICGLVADGVTVVAAAGNSARDMAGFAPGTYDEIISATNVADYDGKPGGQGAKPCTESYAPIDDNPNPRSNWAVSAADQAHTIAAPGTCPYTTKKGNRYGYVASGTSLSAAIISGVVLDCYAEGSCAGKSPAQVYQIIGAQAQAAATQRGKRFAGDPLSPVSGKYFGYLASTVPTGTVGPTPTPTPGGDTQAPTASITAPVSGATVSGPSTVIVAATDNVAVTAVSIWSGTGKLFNLVRQSDGTWRATLSSTNYPNGTYPIVAKATDAAGNTGTSATVTIQIRN